MSGILPNEPSSSSIDDRPACEWTVPAVIPRRDYVRTSRALPSGMPDSLEVHVIRFAEGVERSTVVVYGARAYLVHYEFKSKCNQG